MDRHRANTLVPMSDHLGSWDFRTRPTGLWRRVLWAPVHLFRWHLGFLFGDRFVLIGHLGRRSGTQHQVVVEVVDHDLGAGEYVVCSGTGPAADWYRNLCAAPAPRIQVGSRAWRPAQRLLDRQEAAECFRRYEAAHPPRHGDSCGRWATAMTAPMTGVWR